MVGQYLDRRENILSVGNSETVRTHLANARGYLFRCQREAFNTMAKLTHSI